MSLIYDLTKGRLFVIGALRGRCEYALEGDAILELYLLHTLFYLEFRPPVIFPSEF
jgi:hypothetical protein